VSDSARTAAVAAYGSDGAVDAPPGASWSDSQLSADAWAAGSAPAWATGSAPLRSLFCWSVMMATGYEGGLMKAQLQQAAGIFACQSFAVFSSKEVELRPAPGRIVTENMGDLHCKYGGPYNNVLNSEVFARAWRRVFDDGLYAQAKWTVKADPDAVFLPYRLLHLVRHMDAQDSLYLNNCDAGLHGPIEVISLGGMKALNGNLTHCVDELKKEWPTFGEDVFLRHCLRLIGVKRVDEYKKLLSEEACFHEDPAHDGCISGKVSFHPFKNKEGYFKCLDQAQQQDVDKTLKEQEENFK